MSNPGDRTMKRSASGGSSAAKRARMEKSSAARPADSDDSRTFLRVIRVEGLDDAAGSPSLTEAGDDGAETPCAFGPNQPAAVVAAGVRKVLHLRDSVGKMIGRFVLAPDPRSLRANTFQVHSVASVDGSRPGAGSGPRLLFQTYHAPAVAPPTGNAVIIPPPGMAQLPGPDNDLADVNRVAPSTLTSLGARMETILIPNGPLPVPGPATADPRVAMRWTAYPYTPPPSQATVVAKPEGAVAPAIKVRPWVNDGKAAYVDVFGQDAYDANKANNFPPVGQPNREGLEATVRLMALGFAKKSGETGERATHPKGVGAGGYLQMKPFNAELPELPVYNESSGPAQYAVALRHATLTLEDDAGQDARGCAFRIQTPDGAAVQDFAMNTGETCVFWSLDMVAAFSKAQGEKQLKPYLKHYPLAMSTLADGVRRAPPSFAQLSYSTQISYLVTDKAGEVWVTRFRVIPADRAEEATGRCKDPGMPTAEEQRRLWVLNRAPTEFRPVDYLRKEFAAHFAGGTPKEVEQKVGPGQTFRYTVRETPEAVVRYSFEMKAQRYNPDLQGEASQLNLADAWPAVPWVAIGEIGLNTLLSDSQTENLRFNIGTLPAAGGTRLPPSVNSADFASVAHARAYVYNAVQGVRTGAAPRAEPFATVDTAPMVPPGGPFVATAMSEGYAGADYVTAIDKKIPPVLSSAGYILLPDEAKYTADEAAALNGPTGSKAQFAKNYLQGKTGALQFGGGAGGLAATLRATYSRQGSTDQLSFGLFYPSGGLPITDNLRRTVDHWLVDDYEFARTRLGGLHPIKIRAFRDGDALPGPNDVTADIANRITAAHSGGRLFVCDYSDLARIPAEQRLEGRYFAEPVALFAVENITAATTGASGTALVPVAISLTKPYDTWFCPPGVPAESDPRYYSWLLAKMHVATADILVHEFSAHLTNTHLVSETVLISIYQSFTADHPVFRLLRPHYNDLATIDYGGIAALLQPGQIVDQIMSGGRLSAANVLDDSFAQWRLGAADPDRDAAARGVADLSNLSCGYPYLDDGVPFITAIRKFVAAVLQVYYPADGDLAKDRQLVGWWRTLTATTAKEGGASLNYDGVERIPTAMPGTTDELAGLMASMIWNASAQHSAVNNGQVDFCAFVPNAPMLHRRPVPTAAVGQVTADYITSSLPDLDQSLQQLGFMYILTNDHLLYKDTYLKEIGDIDHAAYLRRAYQLTNHADTAIDGFAKALERVQRDTEGRQASRKAAFREFFQLVDDQSSAGSIPISVEYPYLLPSRANLSITN